MKCVILAAGRGKRMMPLTKDTPKPLLKVGDKCLIDYVLDSLPKEIDEIIIVVDYLGFQIVRHVENRNLRRKVTSVEGSPKGNVYSFLNTKEHFYYGERFLLIYGDEIPNPVDVQKCLDRALSILTYGSWEYGGVMVLNSTIFHFSPRGSKNFRTLLTPFVWKNKVDLVEPVDFIGEINTPKDLERAERWLKSQ